MSLPSGPDNLRAFVNWPGAPFTNSLVLKSLERISISATSTSPQSHHGKLIQWSTYDSIDHEMTYGHPTTVLSSSYSIRKALIRKHFLSRTIHAYVAKRPLSVLKNATPCSWELELSYADELDEMWTDELYDLAIELDKSNESGKWWILKPGMADRGMGIRLFNSRESLLEIFEEFEDADSGSEQSEEESSATAVVTSQLRHFVIQEYLMDPLLLNPHQKNQAAHSAEDNHGFKFHLRAYCVASGNFTLYLCTNILALFSSAPYVSPKCGQAIDLACHLTNTSLQMERGEEGVRLLTELIGCRILSGQGPQVSVVTPADVEKIVDQTSSILAELFEAALGNPVHFQPLPNAFELFGIDFIVRHVETTSGDLPNFQVNILEVNAEPAIELTGPRLSWVLQDLFDAMGQVCIEPFVKPVEQEADLWSVGETRHTLRKSLELIR